MRIPGRLAVALLVAGVASAQARFDVASIRPAAVRFGREGGNRSRIEHSPNSLTMWNVNLSACVEWAYNVAPFQVSGTHTDSRSYDILAKSGTSAPLSQMRVMLQDLLASRFKLVVHRETKLFPVYELVVAKGGPKLVKSRIHRGRWCIRTIRSRRSMATASFFAAPQCPSSRGCCRNCAGSNCRWSTGREFREPSTSSSRPLPARREGDAGALLAIVHRQLGLNLASAKAPFEVVVIDHAEKPSEN